MIKDHLGNTFQTLAEMCKHYNISTTSYRERLKKGLTQKDALTKPKTGFRGYKIKDHLGNEFENLKQMCEFYNITNSIYQDRMKRGWSLEKTLTTPKIQHTSITDCNGNTFKNMRELCAYYHIDRKKYYECIKKGMSQEEILVQRKPKSKPVTDHKGHTYPSTSALCRHYGITRHIYKKRKNENWSLEKILTTPVEKNTFICN